MPPFVADQLNPHFRVGVELNAKEVIRRWPADFGFAVFDNVKTSNDGFQSVYTLSKNLVGFSGRLVIAPIETGDGARCFLFALETDEGRKWLTMMKLTYG